MTTDRNNTPSDKWSVGYKIEDRYEIHDIKSGGMGVVYLCYDHEFKTPVALKTLQDKYLSTPMLVNRFMLEAETWVRLEKHTNIVKAYYVYKIDGRPFIFLEYITGHEKFGPDLKGWIKSMGLDMNMALNVAAQFCAGMIYAQEKFARMKKPFVYRDIKPDNIMITADMKVKITDFGLVKILRDIEGEELTKTLSIDINQQNMELTMPGTIMGTPAYMSPEQWLGKDIDIRTDIYAFGCVFYEMITGKPPFVCSNLAEFMGRHLKEAPAPVTYIPKVINQIILKCLSKEKEERYKDFKTLRQDIGRIYGELTGEELKEEDEEGNMEVWELVNKGISLYNLGHHNEAMECYNEALAKEPYYAEAYHNRGIVYRALKKQESALKDYNEAIRLKPTYAEAYYNRGITYHTMSEFEAAIKDYDEAIKLKSNYIEAYYNRGLAYRAVGESDKAINDYDNAIKYKKGYAKAYYNRGNIYYEQGNLEQAIKDHIAAIKINPKYAEAYYNLALSFEDYGDMKKAIKSWQRYLKAAQDSPSQQEWVEKAKERLKDLKNRYS